MVYVSITGITLRGWWHLPRFGWHAARSFAQARKAAGNLRAEVRRVGDVHHTLTVWTDREAMRAYLVAGPHLRAMRDFRAIGTGRTIGYWSEEPPGWDEALARWQAEAREV